MRDRRHNAIKKLLFLLSVPKCLSCKERLSESDVALCDRCFHKYGEIKNRSCSICGKILIECSCTNGYLNKHFVRGLAKVYRYRNTDEFLPANSILFRLKRKNRNDALEFAASELALAVRSSLPFLDKTTLVTYVPNRKAAIKDNGFDHAELLARAVAQKLEMDFAHLLISLSKKPQKETSGEERFSNANFELISDVELKGRNLLIIDDVVTTGASMGNSAMLLRALRPKAIYGACFGIAFSDAE